MTTSVSIVVPSIEGDPKTLDSVPEGLEVEVVTGKPRSVARNLGAERTAGDVIVFCDDDIEFTEPFFWEVVNETDAGTITGLEDWDFGLLITRFMVVHRSDFERIGGFDERYNYMEDTEFCLGALQKGITLRSVPRDNVYHEEHASVGKTRLVLLTNTLKLAAMYPRYAPTLLRGMLL